jgi:hypothetical protein
MAELLSLCPNCKARLRVPAGSRNEQIDCPKCKSGFVPQKAQVACPKCKTALPPGSVFCIGCGWDFRKKVTTAGTAVFVKAPKEKKREPEPDRFEKPDEEFDQPTWREILGVPFNAEFVMAEAVILTMWAFFWAGLMIAIAGAMIMAFGGGGPFTIFSACMLLAGIIRMWMITSDVTLPQLLGMLAGLLGLSTVTGMIVGRLAEKDAMAVGLGAFLFFILFGVWLRSVSFFMGRYFGLVRRSALRASMSVSDRGGFYDLYYGILIGIVGLGPLLAIETWDFILALREEEFPGGFGVKVGLLTVAGGWAYFYLPMAVATVALKGSANPFLVLKWAFMTFVDYMPLLVLYLPFHAIMWALSAFIVQGVDQMLGFAPALGVILAGLNFFLLQLLLNEYSVCVTLVSLGLVMRRSESVLGWAKDAKRINAERD